MTINDVERLLPNQRITAIGKAADMMWFAMGNDYDWYDELKKCIRKEANTLYTYSVRGV